MEPIKFSEKQKAGMLDEIQTFIDRATTYHKRAIEAKDPIGKVFAVLITDAEKMSAYLTVMAKTTCEE